MPLSKSNQSPRIQCGAAVIHPRTRPSKTEYSGAISCLLVTCLNCWMVLHLSLLRTRYRVPGILAYNIARNSLVRAHPSPVPDTSTRVYCRTRNTRTAGAVRLDYERVPVCSWLLLYQLCILIENLVCTCTSTSTTSCFFPHHCHHQQTDGIACCGCIDICYHSTVSLGLCNTRAWLYDTCCPIIQQLRLRRQHTRAVLVGIVRLPATTRRSYLL